MKKKTKKKAIGFVAVAAMAFVGGSYWAAGQTAVGEGVQVVMYQNPACSCCGEWVKHMRSRGFEVEVHKTDANVNDIKRQENITPKLASCHTAYIDGYIIEGHVPASDIARLLAERPTDIRGLAVPGMISGSPGMEDGRVERYNVLAFDADNKTSIYASY